MRTFHGIKVSTTKPLKEQLILMEAFYSLFPR
jgi:hypothetical protein